MSYKDKQLQQKISDALGSNRVIPLDDLPRSQGPLDLLHLRAEIQDRLSFSGGRPTDPRWEEQEDNGGRISSSGSSGGDEDP